MNPRLTEQLERLPDFLGSHMLLTLCALSIGIALSVPLTLLALYFRRMQPLLLGLAAVIQTIPSLALLALMVPLLRQIGFVPALLALILYSLLPVLRNAVTGIENVDAKLLEAARGLGMTSWQTLLRVQLPLAAPVIIAGVRTATVWVVGIATLSTPVGATSLGNYIFTGLQTQNTTAVLVGCLAAAILALTLDGLIRLLESATVFRSRGRFIAAGMGLLLVVAVALFPIARRAWNESRSSNAGRSPVVIGSKAFTEQYVLAELLKQRLLKEGFAARKTTGMGSSILFDSLANGNVDVSVDYSGTLWANILKREDTKDGATVLQEVSDFLQRKYGIVVLGPLGFENAYALAMPRKKAEVLNVRTLSDLARVTPRLKIGSDYEFFGRPEWQAVQSTYKLQFKERVRMDPALMYQAVQTGQVDVISAFSSDGRIPAYDLRVLDDPKQALPPYDAVLLLSAQAADKPGLREALQPLIGAISDEEMREINRQVDVEGSSVGQAVKALENAVP